MKKTIILLLGSALMLTGCGKIDGGGGGSDKVQNFISVNGEDKFNDYVYLGIYKKSDYLANKEAYISGCSEWSSYTPDEKLCFSNDVMYGSTSDRWNIYYDTAKTGSYTLSIGLSSTDRFGKYVGDQGFINSDYEMNIFWIPSIGGVAGKLANVSTTSTSFRYKFEYDHKYIDEETKTEKTEHISVLQDEYTANDHHTSTNVFKNGSVQIFSSKHKKEDISNLKLVFTGTLNLTVSK